MQNVPTASPQHLTDRSRTWLQSSNECPLCRRPLFQRDRSKNFSFDNGPLVRVSINDDRSNLDRLRNLSWAWQQCSRAARRHEAEYKWHTISEARIDFFRRRRYPVPSSNYARYGATDKRTSHRLPSHGRATWHLKRPLRAAHLTAQLEQRNTWLARDGNKRKTQKPTLACHPVAAGMTDIVAHILRITDGHRVSAAQLASMLANYGGKDMQSIDATAASEGKKSFARHMAEDVVAMHAGFDVQPRGQAVRVRRARSASVEGDGDGDVEMAGDEALHTVGSFLEK